MPRIRLLYRAFRDDILAIPTRALVLLAILLLFIVPFITQDPYILSVLIYTNIFAMFAASWDVLGGYTGVLNLAHGALFGIGAYSAALLNIHFDLQPWLSIPLGAIVAVLAGLIIALPALRLRGLHFALASVAFPVILAGIIFAFPDFSGGETGLFGIDSLAGSKLANYLVTLIVMLLSAFAMWKFVDNRSTALRTGIMLQAIREDEIAARAVGVNTIRYKLIAFMVSGFVAGIAGGLYVHVIRVAGPSTLDLMFVFFPIIYTIFGGPATIIGPIVGTFVLSPFMEVLRAVPEARIMVFAILIVLILYFMPEGIVHKFRDRVEQICPRCKVLNVFTRKACRSCGSDLHLQREL